MQLSPRENTRGLELTQTALSVCAELKAHAYVCANIEHILLREYCWDDESTSTPMNTSVCLTERSMRSMYRTMWHLLSKWPNDREMLKSSSYISDSNKFYEFYYTVSFIRQFIWMFYKTSYHFYSTKNIKNLSNLLMKKIKNKYNDIIL